MVLKKAFLLLIFSIVFATGCSNETEKPGPVLHQETIGDLAYEIKLSKNRFELDDEIVVYTKVTNQGKKTLTYVSGSTTCPSHANVNIIHQESNARLAIKPYGPCTDNLAKSQLVPGQTVEDISTYITQLYSKETSPLGTYDVLVALPSEGISITEDYQSTAINPRPSVKTQIILTNNH